MMRSVALFLSTRHVFGVVMSISMWWSLMTMVLVLVSLYTATSTTIHYATAAATTAVDGIPSTNTDIATTERYCFQQESYADYEAYFGAPTVGATHHQHHGGGSNVNDVDDEEEEDETMVDVVYTWVNGSDPFQLIEKHFWERHDGAVEATKASRSRRAARCEEEMRLAKRYTSDFVKNLAADQYAFVHSTFACAVGAIRSWVSQHCLPSPSLPTLLETDEILRQSVLSELSATTSRHCVLGGPSDNDHGHPSSSSDCANSMSSSELLLIQATSQQQYTHVKEAHRRVIEEVLSPSLNITFLLLQGGLVAQSGKSSSNGGGVDILDVSHWEGLPQRYLDVVSTVVSNMKTIVASSASNNNTNITASTTLPTLALLSALGRFVDQQKISLTAKVSKFSSVGADEEKSVFTRVINSKFQAALKVCNMDDDQDDGSLQPPLSASPPSDGEDHGDSRFTDHDELRFSMRSIDRFTTSTPQASIPLVRCAPFRRFPGRADPPLRSTSTADAGGKKGATPTRRGRRGGGGNKGWIRNFYLVTNGQVPSWLNVSHPRVRVVTHEEIFPTLYPPRYSTVLSTTGILQNKKKSTAAYENPHMSNILSRGAEFAMSKRVQRPLCKDDEDGSSTAFLGCWRRYRPTSDTQHPHYYNEFLPTFSSPAIEAQIHRIRNLDPIYLPPPPHTATTPTTTSQSPRRYSVYEFPTQPPPPPQRGSATTTPTSAVWFPPLSKRFLYFNDDTFLGSDVTLEDFLSSSQSDSRLRSGSQSAAVHVHKLFESWEAPHCNIGCPSQWLGDGQCDVTCNTPQCAFDMDDCASVNNKEALKNKEQSSGSNSNRRIEVTGITTTPPAPNDVGDAANNESSSNKKDVVSDERFVGLGLSESLKVLRNLDQDASTSGVPPPPTAVESLLASAGLRMDVTTGTFKSTDGGIGDELLRLRGDDSGDDTTTLPPSSSQTKRTTRRSSVVVDVDREAFMSTAQDILFETIVSSGDEEASTNSPRCGAQLPNGGDVTNDQHNHHYLPAEFSHWVENAKVRDQVSRNHLKMFDQWRSHTPVDSSNTILPVEAEYLCSFASLLNINVTTTTSSSVPLMCLSDQIGDGVCDEGCNTAACGYDALDCSSGSSGGSNHLPGASIPLPPNDDGTLVVTPLLSNDNHNHNHPGDVVITIPAIRVDVGKVLLKTHGQLADFDVTIATTITAVDGGDVAADAPLRLLAAAYSHVGQSITIVLGPSAPTSEDHPHGLVILNVSISISTSTPGEDAVIIDTIYCGIVVSTTLPPSSASSSCDPSLRVYTYDLSHYDEADGEPSLGTSSSSSSTSLPSTPTTELPIFMWTPADCILETRRNDTLLLLQTSLDKPSSSSLSDAPTTTATPTKPTTTNNPDYYAESLKFTNLLLTQAFGASSRYVPAHMPHLINVDVVESLWGEEEERRRRHDEGRGHHHGDDFSTLSNISNSIWRPFLLQSSRRRFRSQHNVQFGFLHFHFMKHIKAPPRGLHGLISEQLFTDEKPPLLPVSATINRGVSGGVEGTSLKGDIGIFTSDQYRRLALMLWEGVPAVAMGVEDSLTNDPVVNPTKRSLSSGGGSPSENGTSLFLTHLVDPTHAALSTSTTHLHSFLGLGSGGVSLEEGNVEDTPPNGGGGGENGDGRSRSVRTLFKHCCCNPAAIPSHVLTPSPSNYRPTLRAAFRHHSDDAMLGSSSVISGICGNVTWKQYLLDYLIATSVPLVPVPLADSSINGSNVASAIDRFMQDPTAHLTYQHHYDVSLATWQWQFDSYRMEQYDRAILDHSRILHAVGCSSTGSSVTNAVVVDEDDAGVDIMMNRREEDTTTDVHVDGSGGGPVDAVCSHIDCHTLLHTSPCLGLCYIDDLNTPVDVGVLEAMDASIIAVATANDVSTDTVSSSSSLLPTNQNYCSVFKWYTNAIKDIQSMNSEEVIQTTDDNSSATTSSDSKDKPWASAVVYNFGLGATGELGYREKRESKERLVGHTNGIINLININFNTTTTTTSTTASVPSSHQEYLIRREGLLEARDASVASHIRIWSMLAVGTETTADVDELGRKLSALRALNSASTAAKTSSDTPPPPTPSPPMKKSSKPLSKPRTSSTTSSVIVPFPRSIYALDYVQLQVLLSLLGRIHTLQLSLLLKNGTLPNMDVIYPPPTPPTHTDDGTHHPLNPDSGDESDEDTGDDQQPPLSIGAAKAWVAASKSSDSIQRDVDSDDSLPLSDGFYGRFLYLSHIALSFPDMVGADALGTTTSTTSDGGDEEEEPTLSSSSRSAAMPTTTTTTATTPHIPGVTYSYINSIVERAISAHNGGGGIHRVNHDNDTSKLAILHSTLCTFLGEVLFDVSSQTRVGIHEEGVRLEHVKKAAEEAAASASAAAAAEGDETTTPIPPVEASPTPRYSLSMRIPKANLDLLFSRVEHQHQTEHDDDAGAPTFQTRLPLLLPASLLEQLGLPPSLSIENSNITAAMEVPDVLPLHRAISSSPSSSTIVHHVEVPGFTSRLRTNVPHYATESLHHRRRNNKKGTGSSILPRWSAWWSWPNPSYMANGTDGTTSNNHPVPLTPFLIRRSYLGRFLLCPFGSSSGGIAFEERTLSTSPSPLSLSHSTTTTSRELTIRKLSYFLHANRNKYPVLEISSIEATSNAVNGGLYYNNRNRESKPRSTGLAPGQTIEPRSLSSSTLIASSAMALKQQPFYLHAGLQERVRFDMSGLLHATSFPALNPHSITFIMIKNNATVVMKQLDHVRLQRSKFVCLNDDIDHSLLPRHLSSPASTNSSSPLTPPRHQELAGDVVGMLASFLQDYYPNPSPMEVISNDDE